MKNMFKLWRTCDECGRKHFDLIKAIGFTSLTILVGIWVARLG